MSRLFIILRKQSQSYLFLFIVIGITTFLLTIYSFIPKSKNYTDSPFSFLRFSGHPSTSDISFSDRSLNDVSLDYRRMLELETSPKDYNEHHPTLGFGSIYCISLPQRKDRRIMMEKIAKALGVRVTFVDAIPKSSSVVRWIAERAWEVRQEKLERISNHTGLEKSKIGGMGAGSIWLTVSGGKRSNLDILRDIEFPTRQTSTKADPGSPLDWVEYLWSVEDHSTLEAERPDFNVTEFMWDSNEPIEQRQLNEATISTYYNHLRTLRMVLEKGEHSALILEDDVDLEWDLERRWRSLQRHLPDDWETIFLGHCWGRELLKPQFGHPHLHRSTAPLCLHGYGVSLRGAKRLLELYSDPWIAFQTPVDTCIPTFIKLGLRSFSVEPTIINQSKILSSDIQLGTGSKWKGLLEDSVIKRILKSEGKDSKEFSAEQRDGIVDPATLFRYKIKKDRNQNKQLAGTCNQ
ncbi:hypothetical protein BY996DRAFT_6636582 [Phakopsora pachyrhizi]|nr:hypothetical protein BY996DRAFT_6636582 [Phakopsora pachyrhizi]